MCPFAASAESKLVKYLLSNMSAKKKIADKLAVKKFILCSTITIADACVFVAGGFWDCV